MDKLTVDFLVPPENPETKKQSARPIDKTTLQWFEAHKDADYGIKTYATAESVKGMLNEVVGYNGYLRGDKVTINGKEKTIVMVSRLGHMGLSDTGFLPYTETITPDVLPFKGV